MSKSYSPAQYAPVETRDLKRSPNCHFYVNGDNFFPGYRLCISNRIRTFDGVKEELTKSLFRNSTNHQTGHVRNIYTPVGGSKVRSIQDLRDGEHYVAAVNDRFKPLPYREIEDSLRHRLPRHKGFKKIDISRIYTPVQHANEERLRNKSGRAYFQNEHRMGLRLRVHLNRSYEKAATPVKVRSRDRDNWPKILEEIAESLGIPPVERVYKVLNQGGFDPGCFQEIASVEQLEQNDHLVVLTKYDHPRKGPEPGYYSLDGKKNFKIQTSPRVGQYYLYPAFPAEPKQFKHHNKSLNKHRPLPSIGSSTMSPLSNPPNSQGGRSKNSSVKNRGTRQVDYDKDQGGVYRSKQQNNSRGAQQVNDTRDTHVDRPIDQMEAEIVEEEDIRGKEKTTPIPPGTELNKQPSKELKEGSGLENGSQTKSEQDRTAEDAGMNPIDEYEDDSFNRYDRNSAIQNKEQRSSTPASRGEGYGKESREEVRTPASRGESRRKQEKKEDEAASKIQAGVKGYNARKQYRKQKEEQDRNRQAQNQAQDRNKEMNEDQAASKIQASFKGYQTRKEMNLKKQQVRDNKIKREQENRENEAATKIQSGYKGYKARKEYKAIQSKKQDVLQREPSKGTDINDNEKKVDNDKAKADAAVKIQSSYRGYKTRKDYKYKQQQKNRDAVNKGITDNEAATKIQANYKGYKTRKDLAAKKLNQPENKTDSDKEMNSTDSDKEMNSAASTIQANFKGFKVRKEYEIKKKEQKEVKAATKIQSSYRGYKTRKDLAKKKEPQLPDQAPTPKPDNSDELDKAATKIQSGFRGYKARKEYKSKVIGGEIIETDPDQLPESIRTKLSARQGQFIHDTKGQAACDIQRAFRSYRAKKRVLSGESLYEKNDYREKSEADSKVIAAFRGYITRKTEQKNDYREKTDADSKVTAAFRGYITRKTEQEFVRNRSQAATKIQATYRGYQVRQNKFYRIRIVNIFHGVVRGYVTRKLNINAFETHSRVTSVTNGGYYATVVQSLCRGFMTRRAVNVRAASSSSKPKSAHSLQGPTESNVDEAVNSPKASDSKLSYWEDTNIKMYSDKTLRISVAKIQAIVYGYKTRQRYKDLHVKQNKSKEDEFFLESQNMYASKVQACFRGFKFRHISNDFEEVESLNDSDERKLSAKETRKFLGESETKDKEESMFERMSPNISEQQGVESFETKTDCESDKNAEEGQQSDSPRLRRAEKRPRSAISRGSRKSPGIKSTLAERGSSGKVKSQSSETVEPDGFEVEKELTPRSSTRLSGHDSIQSGSLGLSDIGKMQRRGSAKSMSTWKSIDRVKAPGEVEREGESLREIEDDAGELSSIEKNVNAISQLQAAFRAYQLRHELRREVSELMGGGEELMDIEKIKREVSALRKDFTLKSAKVRRLGSYQRSPDRGQVWWDKDSDEKDDERDIKEVIDEKVNAGEDTVGDGDDSFNALERENDTKSSSEGSKGLDNVESGGQKVSVKECSGKIISKEEGAARIQAAMSGYLFRKRASKLQVERKMHARAKVEAAFRGYITRKTEIRIKSAQSRKSETNSAKSSDIERKDSGQKLKSERIKTARTRRRSTKSDRTVFHVQMHSDVIEDRATRLQAAFAGYQTRKVFMSLSKIFIENSQSDQNTSDHQLERMGSLSETDDFKLRHKSIAKIHAAYESYRITNETNQTSRRATRSGGQTSVGSPTSFSRHMVLPPIGRSLPTLQEGSFRPRSGVSIRSYASSMSEGKSKTQPDLYRRYTNVAETGKLSGIEVYIKKKIAATFIQSYARGWVTRQRFRTVTNSTSSQVKSTFSTNHSSSTPSESIHDCSTSSEKSNTSKKGLTSKKLKQGSPSSMSKSLKLDTSDCSVNFTIDHSKKNENDGSKTEKNVLDRKSAGSNSSKSSKATLKSSNDTKESTNRAKEEMNEIVRTRTASVKLEAERRKLIAEKIKLRQEKTEAKEATAHVKKQAEKLKAAKGVSSNRGSPNTLTPIPSSRQQANREPDQEVAAVKIQKVYRGHRARNTLVEKQKTVVQLEHEYKDWKTRRIEAAVAIQSVWRGYLVRKDLADQDDALKCDFVDLKSDFVGFDDESPGLIVINIGRTKSEIERANRKFDNASMIQMVFRACQIRRKLALRGAVRRRDKGRSASKIQALYQGYLTRKHMKQSASATSIQSVCKGFLARVDMENQKKKKLEEQQKAASLLQSAYQSFSKRRQIEAEKEDRRMNRAAVDIQTTIRGFIVRWELGKKKEMLQLTAANKIQGSFRGYRERKQMKQWKHATEVIVAGFRSYNTRKEVKAYKDKLERERKAATRLQAAYRGYVQRRSTKDYKAKQARENKAASKIQCSINGMRARLKYKKLKEELARKRERSALKIQSVYRGHRGRKQARAMKEERKRENSALKIQSVYRGHLGRKEAREIRETKKRESLALKIQSVYRGHLGRNEAKERRRQNAAVKIQSGYRGYKGRQTVRKERHKKEVHGIAVDMVNLMVSRSLDYCRRRSDSAERIQATVKGHCTRRQMVTKLSDDEKIKAKEKKLSATIIQAAVRAKHVRKRREKRNDRKMSATVIQAVVRAKHIRNMQEERRRLEEMNAAAVKIQSLYKGYRTRKDIEKEREIIANIEPPHTGSISARTQSGKLLTISIDEVLMKNSRAIILFHKKATELQNAFRAYQTRTEMKDRLLRKREVTKKTPRRVLSVTKRLSKEDKAAIMIQKTFRGYSDRKVYQNAIVKRRKMWKRAAGVIHAACRGYNMRCLERRKREVYGKDGMRDVFRIKHEAANIIACAYRSLSHRSAKKALRAEM